MIHLSFVFALTIGTYTLWMGLKRGRGVGKWQVAMVLYFCSVRLTIGFCPAFLNTSLSRVFSMLDGWPTILQRTLFFSLSFLLPLSFSLSLSLSLSLYVFFHTFFLFSPSFRLFQFLSPSWILPFSFISFFSHEYRDPLYFSRTTFFLLY